MFFLLPLLYYYIDDGYDYPFQVNYNEKWDQIVEAFQECCDEYPDIKWSLEFKPTDENTRFFTVPSTGAAMLLLRDIDRSNMGLTLDVGHMLMGKTWFFFINVSST
jgi:xylose isomerase